MPAGYVAHGDPSPQNGRMGAAGHESDVGAVVAEHLPGSGDAPVQQPEADQPAGAFRFVLIRGQEFPGRA